MQRRAGTDDTFHDLKRLHRWFSVSALGLLAATVWMLVADHRPEIQQIWLPNLTINYNFRQVARTDRCPTCHLGFDKPAIQSPWDDFQSGPTPSPVPRPPLPFRPHPRLDLFVGPSSPHPMAEFGCTICHDGQGSATEFQFASHTPNDLAEQARWRESHGWSRDTDWDFPMRPKRFAESNCLKCHHDVTDLEPSRRFPDPPAPKLLAGYQLVRQYGCFGCHEIKGTGVAGEWIGPDMRLPKVGPSLLHVADKLDVATLQAWIAEPAQLRPSTRMPQLFGLHEHLDGKGLDEARRFDPIEIRAITDYLVSASRPVPPLPAPPKAVGRISNPSQERGKRLFLLQGCLACHRQGDFPEGQATQGPDLSQLGARLTTPSAKSWLASWIRDPARHSPHTLMPNPLLTADAAADIAAYLVGLTNAGQPKPLAPLHEADLDALVLFYVNKDSHADAAEPTAPVTLEKKLRYVGRQAIRRRGCFGCHEIAGFENAEPIGPALSDWGRKQESLLAFGEVERFLDSKTIESAADREFYLDAVHGRRREGFLWQKLRAPRSFDYMQTDHKGYHEHLLMGRFSLTPAEREAIMTFVLGLVAEAPQEKYLPRPEPRRRAIVEGRKVLDKYACAQCHTLEMERWTVQMTGGRSQVADGRRSTPHIPHATYHLVGMPQRTAEGRLEETEDEDGHPLYAFQLWEPATIDGKVWPVGGAAVLVAPDRVVCKTPPRGGDFTRLLLPMVIAEAKAAGAAVSPQEAWGFVPPPLVHAGEAVQPAWLHDYLLDPSVIRPQAVLHMPKYNLSPEEAGKLADYFAATAGAEFPFDSDARGRAARQAGEQPERVQAWEKAFRLVLDQKTFCGKCHLVGDHRPGAGTPAAALVPSVGSSWTTLAPNLERVAARMRPQYLRRWIADPKAILPYTPMPVNFPVGQRRGQDLLPGSSAEQVDAVSDFLLNYDTFMKRRASNHDTMRKKLQIRNPKSQTTPND